MKMRNPNLFHKSSTQFDNRENSHSNRKDTSRTYSAYQVNAMKQRSLNVAVAARKEANVADAVSNDSMTKEKPPDGHSHFQLNASRKMLLLKSSQGLGSIKTQSQMQKKQCYASSTSTPRFNNKNSAETLKADFTKYRKELNEYNNATKELEDKYMKINMELNDMQQKHERFIASREAEKNLDCITSSREGSEFSLRRKYAQIFNHSETLMVASSERSDLSKKNVGTDPPSHRSTHHESLCDKSQRKKEKELHVDLQSSQPSSIISHHSSKSHSDYNKENVLYFETPTATSSELIQHREHTHTSQSSHMEDIFETLRSVINSEQKGQRKEKVSEPSKLSKSIENTESYISENANCEEKSLRKFIDNLQKDRDRLKNVIMKQQKDFHDLQTRCLKEQHAVETQQTEIDKLNKTNKELQSDLSKGFQQLRQRLNDKLREMAPLSEKLEDEQKKFAKATKGNGVLIERIHTLQDQIKDFKLKIADIMKRKTSLMNRLKNAERDLRIFRNYNTSLKQEKLKQSELIAKLRYQLENVQVAHKQALARQRESGEKNAREQQRRITELEQKLGRSNYSTSNVLQERERLICELQSQINTLVHNFEVSQKHIRILRRHIQSAAGDGNVTVNGVKRKVGT